MQHTLTPLILLRYSKYIFPTSLPALDDHSLYGSSLPRDPAAFLFRRRKHPMVQKYQAVFEKNYLGRKDIHRQPATPQIRVLEKSRFYWSTCPGEAISEKVFDKCLHILLSPKEFEAHQHTLAAVNSSISESHWGNWNERALTKKGFTVIDQPAIVAVAEPDGRFAMQFV